MNKLILLWPCDRIDQWLNKKLLEKRDPVRCYPSPSCHFMTAWQCANIFYLERLDMGISYLRMCIVLDIYINICTIGD